MKIAVLALALCIAFGLSFEEAQAGGCTKRVDQFERATQQPSLPPDAGPTSRETIGADLGHQPTPASVEAAATRAQSRFSALLADAKALDARGRHTACMRALREAKMMFDPQ